MRRVVAVVPDLLFGERLAGSARAAGVALARLDRDAALAACRTADPPDLVIVDLAQPGDPAAFVAALKADPKTASIPVVGFYPHVEGALRAAALAAGADRVLPRSAFVARLPALLTGVEP